MKERAVLVRANYGHVELRLKEVMDERGISRNQLAKLIDPESTIALPALFTPLNDTIAILIGALVLGLIQIITGMAISVVRKIKSAICGVRVMAGPSHLVFLSLIYHILWEKGTVFIKNKKYS